MVCCAVGIPITSLRGVAWTSTSTSHAVGKGTRGVVGSTAGVVPLYSPLYHTLHTLYTSSHTHTPTLTEESDLSP